MLVENTRLCYSWGNSLINMSDNLQHYRRQLDEINFKLLELFAQRFDVTHKIGLLKRDQDLPALDPDRERRVLEKTAQDAIALGLDPDFAQEIMRITMRQTVQEHIKIRQK